MTMHVVLVPMRPAPVQEDCLPCGEGWACRKKCSRAIAMDEKAARTRTFEWSGNISTQDRLFGLSVGEDL